MTRQIPSLWPEQQQQLRAVTAPGPLAWLAVPVMAADPPVVAVSQVHWDGLCGGSDSQRPVLLQVGGPPREVWQ